MKNRIQKIRYLLGIAVSEVAFVLTSFSLLGLPIVWNQILLLTTFTLMSVLIYLFIKRINKPYLRTYILLIIPAIIMGTIVFFDCNVIQAALILTLVAISLEIATRVRIRIGDNFGI